VEAVDATDRRTPPRRVAPVLSVIGRSGAGKTEIVARAVRWLTERGYAVGTVKHAPDLDAVDRPGSDSARHRSAGAIRSLLWGADEAALLWSPGGDDTLPRAIAELLAGSDIVLVEGWKRGPYPKIEVYDRRAAWPEGPLAGEIDVLAVITDDPVALPDGVVAVSRRDADAVASWIEAWLDSSDAQGG
jgi:molybdopterin-guanine dinucleotide biosynthesis protein MobB